MHYVKYISVILNNKSKYWQGQSFLSKSWSGHVPPSLCKVSPLISFAPASRTHSSLEALLVIVWLCYLCYLVSILHLFTGCPGPFLRTHRSCRSHLQSLPSPDLSVLFSPPPAPHSPISLSLYDQCTSFAPLSVCCIRNDLFSLLSLSLCYASSCHWGFWVLY